MNEKVRETHTHTHTSLLHKNNCDKQSKEKNPYDKKSYEWERKK